MGIISGLAIISIIVWRLSAHFDDHSSLERFSMALIAAGVLLMYPSFWHLKTPFDGWAIHMAVTGSALFFSSYVLRRKGREENAQCD